jgi:predicted metal-binding membrane protein
MPSEPEIATKPSALEHFLRKDRAITLAGLLALSLLAWAYVLAGADLGTGAPEMISTSLFPHTMREAQGTAGIHDAGMETSAASWNASTAILILAMWWVMMIAMMTPGVAPAILLYARAHRHAAAQWQLVEGGAPIAFFLGGYLTTWLGFSVLATGLHWLLEQAGLVSALTMSSQSHLLSGSLLLAAGLYEVSPLKRVCLRHCRDPAEFLSRHWRMGAGGAFNLGVRHGAYCVGCCWGLMALLFVGGVMNPVWIAALAILVLIEKLASGGVWMSRIVGLVLIAWGVATYVVITSP